MDLRNGRPALNSAYLRAIEDAGIAPVLIAPGMSGASIETLLDVCDGLMLTGGGDIDPARYGRAPHSETSGVSGERDDAEFSAFALAYERRLPILAICRGMQLANVALGGSLHQHLPDLSGNAINHRQTPEAPREETTHTVSLSPECRLAALLGTRTLSVNSMHHQAVSEAGAGLVVTGYAPDGVVEAMEAGDERWLLAVQWHPEELTGTQEHARRLFAAFAEALAQRKRTKLAGM